MCLNFDTRCNESQNSILSAPYIWYRLQFITKLLTYCTWYLIQGAMTWRYYCPSGPYRWICEPENLGTKHHSLFSLKRGLSKKISKISKFVLKFFLPEIPISCIILQESVIIIFFYYSWDISKKWKTEFHFLGVISKKVSFWQEFALKQKCLARNLHFLGYLTFFVPKIFYFFFL